jgi:hypothetical protein
MPQPSSLASRRSFGLNSRDPDLFHLWTIRPDYGDLAGTFSVSVSKLFNLASADLAHQEVPGSFAKERRGLIEMPESIGFRGITSDKGPATAVTHNNSSSRLAFHTPQ